MAQRPLLGETSTDPRALTAISAFHADTVMEVAAAIKKHRVVVVGMAQNPVVKRACKLLKDAGIDFHFLTYGSYLSEWKRRLAIKLWSGWPTFPQVFVGGVLIGGADDLEVQLRSGAIAKQ